MNALSIILQILPNLGTLATFAQALEEIFTKHNVAPEAQAAVVNAAAAHLATTTPKS